MLSNLIAIATVDHVWHSPFVWAFLPALLGLLGGGGGGVAAGLFGGGVLDNLTGGKLSGGINDILGPTGMQEDAYNKMFGWANKARKNWKDYAQPGYDTALEFLKGINPALESGIAGQRNAASDRILGGLSGRGTVNSGAQAALESLASRNATQALGEGRLATQQTGLGALQGFSGQLEQLLSGQASALGGVTSSFMRAESPLLQLLLSVLGGTGSTAVGALI